MQRYPENPIISRHNLQLNHPALQDVTSVFNPGGVRFDGHFLLLLRVQNRARETFFVKAVSADGIHFDIADRPVDIKHLHRCPHQVYHIYDPRITADKAGAFHILCAMDTDNGCFLGYFCTMDFEELDFMGLASGANVRNGVILKGSSYRFERPNDQQMADGVRTGSRIICSTSRDLLSWQEVAPVFSGRAHYWDELIGSGPPPLLCNQGWLHIYHGVATHFGSSNIYQAGISLQDRDKPWICLARGRYNILEPREMYELTGQVPNVVFPSAAIPLSDDEVLADDTPIYIYYGAADTCVALAISSPRELIAAAHAM